MVSDDNYTPVLLIYYISFVQMLSAVVCVGQNSKIFLNSKDNLLKSLKVYLNKYEDEKSRFCQTLLFVGGSSAAVTAMV